ncbi:unnamed protein product [Blepharisma stoltei]|uniref:Ion transport domain-containing protein n=1 Tax=Blepharisma stoltei TaxID=1481888 RepID=A0AAU9IAF6_9CILI|nr:unnamed protein product [Blepharisma stoltei]
MGDLNRPLLGLSNSNTQDLSPLKLERSPAKDQKSSSDSSVYYLSMGKIEKRKRKGSIEKFIRKFNYFVPVEAFADFKCNFDITSDKNYVFSGTSEGDLAMYGFDEKRIQTQKVAHQAVSYIKLDSSNDYIFIGVIDGVIGRLNLGGDYEIDEFLCHKSMITGIKVSSDDEWMYSSSKDSKIIKWRVEDKEPKLLYKHENANEIDLSEDNKIIISSGSDKLVKVWNVDTNAEVIALGPMGFEIKCIKFSKSKFIACGTSDGEIKVWEWGSFEVKHIFHMDDKNCSAIGFLYGEDYLVSSYKTIQIWNMWTGESDITLNNQRSETIRLLVDQNKIFSSTKDKRFLIWNFPEIPDQVCIQAHDGEILDMLWNSEYKLYFSLGVDRKIIAWEVGTNEKKHEFYCEGNSTPTMCLTPDKDYIVTTYKHGLMFWDFTYGKTWEHEVSEECSVNALIFSPSGEYFITGDDKWMTFFKYKAGNLYQNWKILRQFTITSPISAWDMTENDSILIVGLKSGDIWLFSLIANKPTKVCELLGHTDFISGLQLLRNEDHFISVSYDTTIRIWNLNKKWCMRVIKYHADKILSLVIPNNECFIVSSKDKSISIWALNSFSLVTALNYQSGGKVFIFPGIDYKLYLAQIGGEICIQKNPLGDDFAFYGPGKKICLFLNYVNNILTRQNQKYIEELDKWVIMPYKINTTHLFSYFQMPNHLKCALDNDSAFFETSFWENPLSLSLAGSSNIISIILYGLCRKVSFNPYEVQLISGYLPQLNIEWYKYPKPLEQLYQSILHPVKIINNVPQFCESLPSPIVHKSDYLSIVPTDLIPISQLKKRGQPIVFWENALWVHQYGSYESLKFLNSLYEHPNPEILRTKFVKAILDSKWRDVRYVLFCYGLIYISFLILYFIHTLDRHHNPESMLLPIFVINAVMLLFEFLQMYLSGRDYWGDIWNFFDMTRCSFVILYAVLVWVIGINELTNYFLSWITLISWIRGVAFFRFFERTRYMVRLLREVLSDIESFFFLLFYSTFGFGVVFMAVQNNPEKSFFSVLSWSYLIDLSSIEIESYDISDYAVFLFASVVNLIIMMNILISVIGDTYDRVQEGIIVADRIELLEIIIEGETLAYWNRKNESHSFIQMLTLDKNEEDYTWLGKVREIKARLITLSKTVDQTVEKNDKRAEKLDKNLAKIKASNKSLEERLKVMKKHNKLMEENFEAFSNKMDEKMRNLEDLLTKAIKSQ